MKLAGAAVFLGFTLVTLGLWLLSYPVAIVFVGAVLVVAGLISDLE